MEGTECFLGCLYVLTEEVHDGSEEREAMLLAELRTVLKSNLTQTGKKGKVKNLMLDVLFLTISYLFQET